MPYAVIHGAKNTLVIPFRRGPHPVARKIWQRRRGVGCCGLGQDDTVDTSGSDIGIDLTDNTGTVYGSSAPTSPLGPVTATGAPASATVAPTGSIGSPCPDGNGVIIDNYGSCGPSSTLAANLSTTAGQSALGLSPSQAAAILASIGTATKAVAVAVSGGCPAGYALNAGGSCSPASAVVSTVGTIGGIPTTYLIFGGLGLLALVLISGKKR